MAAPPPSQPAAQIASEPVAVPAAPPTAPSPLHPNKPTNPFLPKDPTHKPRRLARAPLAEAAGFADAVENAKMADTWTRAHGAPDDVDALRNALRFSAGLHDSYGLATDRLMRYQV